MSTLQNQAELDELVNRVVKSAEEKKAKEAALAEAKAAEEKAAAEAAAKAEEEAKAAEAAKAAAPAEPETREQKMAKIRAALAKANDGEEQQETASETRAAAPLPPLRRMGEKSAAVKNAAADTAELSLRELQEQKRAQKSAAVASAGALAAVSAAADAAETPAPEPKDPPKKKHSSKTAAKKKSPKPVSGVPAGMIGGILGGAVAIAAVVSFVIVAGTYREKFLPNTHVNAIDVAGMTPTEAETKLLSTVKPDDLKLKTASGNLVVFKAEDFDACYTLPAGALLDASAESPYTWVGKLFSSTEYKVDYEFHYDKDKLRDLIRNYNWGNELSQDAHIVRKGNEFEIEPETLGDRFDTAMLLDYVAENIENGVTSFNMLDSGCYEKFRAKITTEDLQDELALYNKLAKTTITYDFDDVKKYVTGNQIVDWLQIDENGSAVIDEYGRIKFNWDGVAAFVDDMAEETDTFGKPHEFYSTMDGWITVPWNGNYSSTYGWQINREETTQQLIDTMREAENVTIEPIYTQTAASRKSDDDIGNTYIDADISAQHFWVYVDGECVLDADFVSGTETDPERRTPRGVCQILSKESPRKLGTYAVQGYETWVDYWMPFDWLGCGFHDLRRGAYGGSIYMYNGSHGCLNLQHSIAEQLYSIVYIGMPVMVHD